MSKVKCYEIATFLVAKARFISVAANSSRIDFLWLDERQRPKTTIYCVDHRDISVEVDVLKHTTKR